MKISLSPILLILLFSSCEIQQQEHVTPLPKDDSSTGLREKIIYQLERNLSLGGDVTKEMLDFLTPIEDNTSFVDLAAYSLCKQSLRKQALLEVQNLGKRAQMLIDDLIWENDRLDLINKALGGKDEESNFN